MSNDKVRAAARGETITFDALVAHGLERCKAEGREYNIVNGMPWSFDFHGIDVTHENDNCYLLNTTAGTVRVDRPAPKVEPAPECEYGAMGRHKWLRTADNNTDICIGCKRYRAVVPPTPPAKVEPVADSPEQSTASTPTKLGSGPSLEGAVGSDATTSSATDEVARVLARLRELAVPDDIDGTLTTFEPDRTMLAAASLLERLAAELAAMTLDRDQWKSLSGMRGAAREDRLWAERDAMTAERDNMRGAVRIVQDSCETAIAAMTAERDAALKRAEAAERDAARLRDDMRHIAEYWSGNRNDRAMYDALTTIVEVADAAIAKGAA